MNTIIALRGKGNSGKTTTIRILHDLLSGNGYTVIRTNFNPVKGDFITIFKKKGKIIGVTSSGDTYDLVHDRLEEMVNEKCEICVCACRTYDQNAKPGTNAAVREFTSYRNQFVEKTIDETTKSSQYSTNTRDAQTLHKLIESML